MKRIMTSILLSIGFFLQLGCTNPSAYVDKQTFDAHADLEKIGAYKLQPLDPLFIRFSGVLDQVQLEPVIDENGEISLLHIEDSIVAAGLTTSELEDKIEV